MLKVPAAHQFLEPKQGYHNVSKRVSKSPVWKKVLLLYHKVFAALETTNAPIITAVTQHSTQDAFMFALGCN